MIIVTLASIFGKMTEVTFFNPEFDPGTKLVYSIVVARYKNKWLFVRHHKRETLEIAGGHIEDNESPDEAAKRELSEETGAKDFLIDCIATYSVRKKGTTGFGRLYFAEVTNLDPIPISSEIADLVQMDHLPDKLTHPDIQPQLFKHVQEYLKSKEAS